MADCNYSFIEELCEERVFDEQFELEDIEEDFELSRCLPLNSK